MADEFNLQNLTSAAEKERKRRLRLAKSQPNLPEIMVMPMEDGDGVHGAFPMWAGFMVSLIFHTTLLLVFALYSFSQTPGQPYQLFFDGGFTEQYISYDLSETPADTNTPQITIADILLEETPISENDTILETSAYTTITIPKIKTNESNPPQQEQNSENTQNGENAPGGTPGVASSEDHSPPTARSPSPIDGTAAETRIPQFPETGTLIGRTDLKIREKLLKEDGGTPSSEQAVLRGLRWLEAHQQINKTSKNRGGWSFNLHDAPGCNGKCRHSGEEISTTAATSLALLAMLGYGNTREKGEFQTCIAEGLYHLSVKARQRNGIPGYDLRDGGRMYAQALSALTFCEAYILEDKKDTDLEKLAKGSIEWLIWAQNQETGGWRYMPQQAGDVTVTVWVLMALKSGKMAGFNIPSQTMIGMERFLQSVSSDHGTRFSYRPGEDPIRSTTAVGLFGKMFTGSPREAAFLQNGTALLAEWQHSPTDIYYDYYATMIMRHYGGQRWHKWNTAMRDYLIATQEFRGHETGSWYFDEPDKTHNQYGGRLYTTAFATMILEVYYRYMPLYQEETIRKRML